MTAGLGNPRGLVRLRFAETLSEIGEAATPFLIKALTHHADVVVRRAAAKTCAGSVGNLYAEDTKGHAAWALVFIGSEAADHLHAALNNSSLDVRCAVIGALGHDVAQEQSDEKPSQLLVQALSDPETLMQRQYWRR